MPESTFYETAQDGKTRYVCTIPYTTQPGGICGHWSSDFTLFRQHMEQQHQGLLIAGEPPAPEPEEPDDVPEPEEPPPIRPPRPPEEPEKEPVTTAGPATPAASEPVEA